MHGIAVVGMGHWGRNLVRNFHELRALHIVCDAISAHGEIVRQKYPGVRFCTSYDQVLEDNEVRALVLATPAVTHYRMARVALERGKDVFVEKPLSLTVREGEDLVRLAGERRRILMVGHVLRYHPAVIQLQNLIRDGRLGRIQYVYSNRLNIGRIRTEENILWSFAPHDISVILSLLQEAPESVTCQGSGFLHHDVADVTMSQFSFGSGVLGHIFVSWLHPFKEQRLVVVGSERMAVFDDTAPDKLVLYPHRVEWRNRVPTAVKGEPDRVEIANDEPLRSECRHFIDCIEARLEPLTNGQEGLSVLRVLDACQEALTTGRKVAVRGEGTETKFQAHPSAVVDPAAEVGAGTRIWHFSHIMSGARIGERCVLGQNVNVDGGAVIGNNVKIQNNVSIYAGVVIEDDVFLGPSCVLTNVSNPRSQINRHKLYERTVLRRGCSIGANATIRCGLVIGRYSFVAAGSVVTSDVPDYALVMGNPARQNGWMSRHGHRLERNGDGVMTCPESGYRYREIAPGVLRCLDLDEEEPLPPEMSVGQKPYHEFKNTVPAALGAGVKGA